MVAEATVNTDWRIEDGVVLENGVVGPEGGDIGRMVSRRPAWRRRRAPDNS